MAEAAKHESSRLPSANRMVPSASDLPVSTWLSLAGLAFRSLMIPICIAMCFGVDRSAATASMWLGLVLFLANLPLIAVVYRQRGAQLMSSNWLFAGDLCIAYMANLYAAHFVRHGTFLLQGRDIFWQYLLGTVVLWTSVRGYRWGLASVAGAVVLEIVMFRQNDAALTIGSGAQACGRIGWQLAAIVVPVAIARLAARAESRASEDGERAGKAYERRQQLRRMHDSVAQVLSQVALLSETANSTNAEYHASLSRIAALLNDRMPELVSSPHANMSNSPNALVLEIARLESRYRDLRLSVEISDEVGEGLEMTAQIQGLLDATDASLDNVRRHAGDCEVRLHVTATPEGLGVTVTDNGRGFNLDEVPAGCFGIRESVRARIDGIGGVCDIESAPGAGTSVRLVVPRVSGSAHIGRPAETLLAADPKNPDSFTWFALPALAYRICLTPILIALGLARFHRLVPTTLWPVLGAILAIDTSAAIWFRSRLVASILRWKPTLAIDIALIATVNVWQATRLSGRNLLDPGAQVFFPYFFGVVILWAGLRGIRTGVWVFVGASVFEIALALAKGVSVSLASESEAFAQIGQLGVALLQAWLIMFLAYRGVRLARDAGEAAGREAEKLSQLWNLYAKALADLEEIVSLCAMGDSSAESTRLRSIRGIALECLARVRAALDEAHSEPEGPLQVGLQDAVRVRRRRGLRVETVIDDEYIEPDEASTSALLETVGWALDNVVEHAGIEHAVVRVFQTGDFVEATVRDQGVGLHDGDRERSGEYRRLEQLLQSVGGRITWTSSPGSGTKVSVRVRTEPTTFGPI